MTSDAGTSDLTGRTVLVTGATGFVGSHVTRALVRAGARVHVLVRPTSPRWRLADLADHVQVQQGDVTDALSVRECYRASKPYVVIHLAGDTACRNFDGQWRGIERSVAVNLQGTLGMLRGAFEAEAPPAVFVRSGGLEEYGDCATPYDEQQREQPVSPYSASQVAATHYAQMLQRNAPFTIVTLRPALAYGPAQSPAFLIPALIRSCLEGKDFEMTTGDQRRDLLYVEDLADAFVRTAARPALRGAVLNVASGEEHAIRDVADRIVRLTGASIHLRAGARSARPGDLQHLVGGTDRARRMLGWQASVPLDEGLARTVAWYREHPGSGGA